MAVAREELLDAQRPRAVSRADEHNISIAARNQLEPAQDESAHHDLTQLAVGLNERQQRVAIELDDFAWLSGAYSNDDGPAG